MEARDDTTTEFQIIREGFETEEAQKKAYRNLDTSLNPVDLISSRFTSYSAPSQIESIDKEGSCSELMTVDEFRSNRFLSKQGTSDTVLIFIKKVDVNKYLKWEALRLEIE